MSALSELLERIEKAEGGSPDLDYAVCNALGYTSPPARPYRCDVTRSIDSAVALVEWKLPGWMWLHTATNDGRSATSLDDWRVVLFPFSERQAAIKDRRGMNFDTVKSKAATMPLALLSALLRSLIDREENNG